MPPPRAPTSPSISSQILRPSTYTRTADTHTQHAGTQYTFPFLISPSRQFASRPMRSADIFASRGGGGMNTEDSGVQGGRGVALAEMRRGEWWLRGV